MCLNPRPTSSAGTITMISPLSEQESNSNKAIKKIDSEATDSSKITLTTPSLLSNPEVAMANPINSLKMSSSSAKE